VVSESKTLRKVSLIWSQEEGVAVELRKLHSAAALYNFCSSSDVRMIGRRWPMWKNRMNMSFRETDF
jgi:hypothetical protein